MTKFIEHILKNRKKELEDSGIQSPLVFPQSRDPMKSATMSKVIQKVCKVIGFEFNAHDLSERLALIDVLWGEEAGKINGSQRDWVLLLMLTGLRYHEPLSLRWENID